MADFTIRPIRQEDFDGWNTLWQAYLEFYESRVSEQVTATTFKRLCDPDCHDQNALVAEQNGQLIGLVHYIFHAHNWREDQVTYLQDLFAQKEARGLGLGRALIEAVYEAADANSAPAVYWLTQEFNTDARKLYDRIGTLTPFIKYART